MWNLPCSFLLAYSMAKLSLVWWQPFQVILGAATKKFLVVKVASAASFRNQFLCLTAKPAAFAPTEVSVGSSDQLQPEVEDVKINFTKTISALSTLEDGQPVNVRVRVLTRREDSQWNRSWIVQDANGSDKTVMLIMKRSKRSQDFANFFEVWSLISYRWLSSFEILLA